MHMFASEHIGRTMTDVLTSCLNLSIVFDKHLYAGFLKGKVTNIFISPSSVYTFSVAPENSLQTSQSAASDNTSSSVFGSSYPPNSTIPSVPRVYNRQSSHDSVGSQQRSRIMIPYSGSRQSQYEDGSPSSMPDSQRRQSSAARLESYHSNNFTTYRDSYEESYSPPGSSARSILSGPSSLSSFSASELRSSNGGPLRSNLSGGSSRDVGVRPSPYNTSFVRQNSSRGYESPVEEYQHRYSHSSDELAIGQHSRYESCDLSALSLYSAKQQQYDAPPPVVPQRFQPYPPVHSTPDDDMVKSYDQERKQNLMKVRRLYIPLREDRKTDAVAFAVCQEQNPDEKYVSIIEIGFLTLSLITSFNSFIVYIYIYICTSLVLAVVALCIYTDMHLTIYYIFYIFSHMVVMKMQYGLFSSSGHACSSSKCVKSTHPLSIAALLELHCPHIDLCKSTGSKGNGKTTDIL